MTPACMRMLSLLLCALAIPLPAQEQQYKLIIVRGENAQNNVKKGRATRPVVEVRDRNDKPVAGVLITFTLPQNGASGTFVNGSKLFTATTDQAGQASAAVQPNTATGSYNISVSAKVNGQTLTAQIPQANVSAGVSGTTIAVIAGIAAAAAAGIAVGLTRGGSSTPATPTPAAVQIGLGGAATIIPPR